MLEIDRLVGDFNRNVICIGGLPFDAIGLHGAVDRICSAIAARSQLFLSTPNLNFLMAAQSDAAFRDSVIHSDLSVVDGMPLVWTARLMGLPIQERVAGATLFDALRQGAASERLGRPISVYFFGGPPGVAEKAAGAINACGQHMVCAGFHCPGFGSVADMSSPEVIEAINASGADFLVVALGAKKGQAWIEHNRRSITVPVISHLGAVVNFAAGTVARAPMAWQQLGLEWLWRIKEEPTLFRRYWADGMGFVRLLLTQTLPYVLQRNSSGLSADGEGVFTVCEEGNGCRVHFSGILGDRVLAKWREYLRRDACYERMVVDMREVSAVCPDFFGVLLMLRKSLDAKDASLAIEGVTPEVKRWFDCNGLNYLINPA